MRKVSKPKVLYTTADASPQSGAFRSLLYMSRRITDYGYDSVLALHQEAQNSALLNHKEIHEAHFFKLPRAKRGKSLGYYLNYLYLNILSIYALVRCIRREQVSVVHINEILDLYAALAAKIAGVPCVWHIRADLAEVPWLRWLLPRIVCAFSKRTIVVSKSVEERLFVDQGVSTSNVRVVHDPGPDPKEFHTGIDGEMLRRELGVGEKDFVVTLVGKLVEMKGHETLIESVPIVLQDFPNTSFLLVGGEIAGRHQNYAKKLRNLAEGLGVSRKVISTGFRSDIPQIMSASDIVVHCSMYPDPFPGVVLQGMAVGKPVIASNLGGPREQIEDGVSGLLVDPEAPKALAEAICRLLADPAGRDRIGAAAAARVKVEFAADVFFGSLSRVYEELIALS